MDYKPRQSYKGENYSYKKRRIFWFNSAFCDDFTLNDLKINDISFNVPPFQTFRKNNLKFLTYVREDTNAKPIIIKLEEPFLNSGTVINTDKEAHPIIYSNHTGVEMMTSKFNKFELSPQQIPKFIFRLDDTINKLNYGRPEGIAANETLIQTTNNSIVVSKNSQYKINYQTPTLIPKGTYESIFSNGAINFMPKPNYNYPILNKTPLIWYKFDMNNYLYDSSGNNYNLISMNGASASASVYKKGDGSALFVKENDQYLRLPNSPNLNAINIANGISFSFWFRLSSTDGDAGLFCSGNTAGASGGIASRLLNIQIAWGGNDMILQLLKADGTYIPFSYNLPNIGNNNNWYHLVWTISPTGVWNVYLNNSAILSNSQKEVIPPFLETNKQFWIGKNVYSDIRRNISGNIDDFRLYDYVLSPIEIYDLYNGNADRSYPILKDANNDTINPLAWYKFDGNLIADETGNYNLTNNGAVLNTSDFVKGNNSASFNGTNQSLTNSNAFNLNSKDFSISCWVKRTDNSSVDLFFQLGSVISDNQTLILGYNSTNVIRFAFYNNDLDTPLTYSDAGNWVHLAFTYKTGTRARKIYRNGVLVASGTASAELNTNNSLRVGFYSIYYYKGLLDDLRIYESELTSTQVGELYNGRIGIYNPPNFTIGLELEDAELVPDNIISPYI